MQAWKNLDTIAFPEPVNRQEQASGTNMQSVYERHKDRNNILIEL